MLYFREEIFRVAAVAVSKIKTIMKRQLSKIRF